MSLRFPASLRLRRRFFTRDPITLAMDLLGCALVWKKGDRVLAVRLVEVEAYLGEGEDPASHAWRGRTARNSQMFATGGRLYVYFTYGMHYCMNVVSGKEGQAGAVLLRAAEPLVGEALMERRRGRGGRELTNGPAKLCQAMGIDLRHNGLDLVEGPLGIWPHERPGSIVRTPRIGIRRGRELLLRFHDPVSPYVSHRSQRKPRSEH